MANTVVFFREYHFYPVEFLDVRACGKSFEEQAADHAELNPGTLRIEATDGTVLWRNDDA